MLVKVKFRCTKIIKNELLNFYSNFSTNNINYYNANKITETIYEFEVIFANRVLLNKTLNYISISSNNIEIISVKLLTKPDNTLFDNLDI